MIEPLQIWKGFHWSFFINIQALIISLRRFETYLHLPDLARAEIELATATEMMLASSASMELAGSFNPQSYQHEIRQSMMPPAVCSPSFSGLMSWEHAALVQIWKRLRPVFLNLPAELEPQHQHFVEAYLELVRAHRSVCERLGGKEEGSIRFEKTTALATLDNFARSRLKLIDVPSRDGEDCPYSRQF